MGYDDAARNMRYFAFGVAGLILVLWLGRLGK